MGPHRDPGLLEAHNLAVGAVLDHIEQYGATTRIRVDDARQHPDVDGLIMAAFPQATSREDDPQLHTHVVISAKVLAPDGRWLALDGRYLKRKQRALGGLYQSVLRVELTSRYGVAWGPIEKGQAEIAGMPKELLDAFSKRTAQVDAALADKITEFREREGRDPTRWERAALTREASEDTRAKKTHASPGDLGSHWRDQAEALGWSPARLLERMWDSARTHPTPEPPTVVDVIEQLSAAGSAWNRADVLQAVCDLTPPVAGVHGQRWAAAVERACDRVIETCTTLDPPSERSPRRASDGRSIWIAPIEPHLTTEAVLAQEERILLFAIDAHDTPARRRPLWTGAVSTSSRPTPQPQSPAMTRSSSSSVPPAPARQPRSGGPPPPSAPKAAMSSPSHPPPRRPRSSGTRPGSSPPRSPSCSTSGATGSPTTSTGSRRAPR